MTWVESLRTRIILQFLAVTRPLKKAVPVANRVAEGEFVPPGEAEAERDIGGLLRSLGRMDESLSQYRSWAEQHRRELERRMADRTCEPQLASRITPRPQAAPADPQAVDHARAVLEAAAGDSGGYAEAAREPAPEAFSKDAALLKMGGDEEVLREVVMAFLEEWEETVGRLEVAVRLRDANALHLAAHTLKGSIAMFSEGPVYEAALELDRCGRDNRLETSQQSYQRLRRELDRLLPELRALCAQAGAVC